MGYSVGRQEAADRTVADHEQRLRVLEADRLAEAEARTNIEWIRAKTEEINQKMIMMDVQLRGVK